MTEEGFLDRLLAVVSGYKRIMVVGRVDTGKSTLVKNLADHMDAYVLDADIGQNDIGPPSVVSLGERVAGRYRMIDGYFCGSTTPSRHFLQMIAGVSRILPRDEKRPVLINTTGLATGEIGRALKIEKINAVKPDLIIGLETGNELKYLDAFSKAGAKVVKFRPHPRVTSRSRAMRDSLRAAAFQAHFQGAFTTAHMLDGLGVERSLLNNGMMVEISVLKAFPDADIIHAEVADGEALVVYNGRLTDKDDIASILGVRTVYAYKPGDFSGVLTGLLDSHGALLALGLIDFLDFEEGNIKIFSAAKDFRVLQFGSVRINRDEFLSAGTFSPEILRLKKVED
jgi:polynucleotide 5'-hydroxyl-kinase GRC3/NOL9